VLPTSPPHAPAPLTCVVEGVVHIGLCHDGPGLCHRLLHLEQLGVLRARQTAAAGSWCERCHQAPARQLAAACGGARTWRTRSQQPAMHGPTHPGHRDAEEGRVCGHLCACWRRQQQCGHRGAQQAAPKALDQRLQLQLRRDGGRRSVLICRRVRRGGSRGWQRGVFTNNSGQNHRPLKPNPAPQPTSAEWCGILAAPHSGSRSWRAPLDGQRRRSLAGQPTCLLHAGGCRVQLKFKRWTLGDAPTRLGSQAPASAAAAQHPRVSK
jgi:hypothetical protein